MSTFHAALCGAVNSRPNDLFNDTDVIGIIITISSEVYHNNSHSHRTWYCVTEPKTRRLFVVSTVGCNHVLSEAHTGVKNPALSACKPVRGCQWRLAAKESVFVYHSAAALAEEKPEANRISLSFCCAAHSRIRYVTILYVTIGYVTIVYVTIPHVPIVYVTLRWRRL